MSRRMTSSIRFGRVAGIEIGANWSLLLVVALLVWSLAAGVFPETNPGLGDGTYVAMAAVAAVLFFASILLHELGHALQAKRDGVDIDGITLWVFGGVARLRGELPSAGAELRIAVAGPVVSLVLGVAFLVAALAVPLPPEVDGVAFWVGQTNLLLLAFNLLPAFPLDGGRVLRALLWMRRRDLLSATRTAAAIGRAFGQLMIGAGLLMVIFVGAFGGVWLAFIGWFVLGAAEAEQRAAALRDALDGLVVGDAMVRDPVTVDADASVQTFMDQAFLPTRHTAFPVLDDGRPLGLVTFRDALRLPRESWPIVRVRDLAGRSECLDPDTLLAAALPQLAADPLGRALVCRDGRLVGLLSLTDVAYLMQTRRPGTVTRPRRSDLRPSPRFATAGKGDATRDQRTRVALVAPAAR
jgi:Zn-dependent protease/CBS domain-containing protein